jgi:hypothetical protein
MPNLFRSVNALYVFAIGASNASLCTVLGGNTVAIAWMFSTSLISLFSFVVALNSPSGSFGHMILHVSIITAFAMHTARALSAADTSLNFFVDRFLAPGIDLNVD